MSYQPTPSGDPSEFSPDRIRRRSTARDYVIYAIVLALLAVMVGGAVYYFTRTEADQARLREQTLGRWRTWNGADREPPRTFQLKQPKLDGILGEERGNVAETAAAERRSSKPAPAKPVAVSTYAGGATNQLVFSSDPNAPKAGPAFVAFAQAMRISGVFEASPAKAMLNGRWFKAGEVVDAESGVRFVGVESAGKRIVLRDGSGAEVRVTY